MSNTHQDRVAAKAARLAALRGDDPVGEEVPAIAEVAPEPPTPQPGPVVQPEPERAPAPPAAPVLPPSGPQPEDEASEGAEASTKPSAESEVDAEEPDVPESQEEEPRPTKATASIPKPRPVKGSKRAPKPADDSEDGSKIVQVALSMDRDLVDLAKLAVPALGGPTLARLVMQAARLYRGEALELPDSPVTSTVIDDWYDDVDTQAHHRTQMTIYMTKRGRARLDLDAGQLPRSSFVRRVLRRHLTQGKVFVPVDQIHLLRTREGIKEVVELLRANANRPARELPMAAGRTWAMVELESDTPLHAALAAAQESMPGCRSATQALLTVLS